MAADPGNEKVIQMLFKTGAVRVCQEGKPFWYTSGTIGPYYINTHFLLDGEKQAQSLLDFIDGELQNRSGLPGRLLVRVKQVYDRNGVFRQLMDLLTEKVQTMLPSDAYDAVSGGERRDWLFSLMAAVLLQKPHVTFYKDLSAVLTHGPDHDRDEPGVDLGTAGPGPVHGMRLLHIADLLNEASSFTRAWIPAARALQARMDDALVIVDRGQGGKALLSEAGTRLHTLAAAGDEMFQRAFSLGWVTRAQLDMILPYLADPRESMKKFLMEHPGYLAESLAGDPKTAERARLCIEKQIYGDLSGLLLPSA